MMAFCKHEQTLDKALATTTANRRLTLFHAFWAFNVKGGNIEKRNTVKPGTR
jgi:hypothetical protein